MVMTSEQKMEELKLAIFNCSVGIATSTSEEEMDKFEVRKQAYQLLLRKIKKGEVK